VGLIENEPDTWISNIAKQHSRLLDYVARVQAAVGVNARDPATTALDDEY
jgi:hypothetical protein